MSDIHFTPHELADYERDGFYIVRGLYNGGEIDKLRRFAEEDPSFSGSVYGRKDSTGHETKLALWNHAGDDLYGMFARSPRIVERMEQMLGGEVYLYHMKMMLKEPRVGGAWEWHQDYGYWYHNGCLFPFLASCLIAVSRANQANGCLQVIRGSHLMGGSTTVARAIRPAPTWNRSTRPSRGWPCCTSNASRGTRSSSTAICCTAAT
jgi:hypothetical protein